MLAGLDEHINDFLVLHRDSRHLRELPCWQLVRGRVVAACSMLLYTRLCLDVHVINCMRGGDGIVHDLCSWILLHWQCRGTRCLQL